METLVCPSVSRLLRSAGGIETPAVGSWSLAADQPLACERRRRRRRTLRATTSRGTLYIDADPAAAAFDLAVDVADLGSLRFSSRRVVVGPNGRWLASGPFTSDDGIRPGRLILHYDGVYRNGDRAVAVIGIDAWTRVNGETLHLYGALNADAPGSL